MDTTKHANTNGCMKQGVWEHLDQVHGTPGAVPSRRVWERVLLMSDAPPS